MTPCFSSQNWTAAGSFKAVYPEIQPATLKRPPRRQTTKHPQILTSPYKKEAAP